MVKMHPSIKKTRNMHPIAMNIKGKEAVFKMAKTSL